MPRVRRVRRPSSSSHCQNSLAGLDDPVGDHVHRGVEVEVLPLGAVRPPVADLRDPGRRGHQLLAGAALGAQPAARDRAGRVALDLDDLLVLDEHLLRAADGAVGADRARRPVSACDGAGLQRVGCAPTSRRAATEPVGPGELADAAATLEERLAAHALTVPAVRVPRHRRLPRSACFRPVGGSWHPRVCRGGVPRLVTGAVLKTVVAEHLGQAGSIPVRLRHGTRHVRRRVQWTDPRRRTPRTDAVLDAPALAEPRARGSAGRGSSAIVSDVLRGLPRGPASRPDDVVAVVLASLPRDRHRRCARSSTRPASSCTPTSAGPRCPRPPSRRSATAAGATDVELDLATGRRGPRGAAPWPPWPPRYPTPAACTW